MAGEDDGYGNEENEMDAREGRSVSTARRPHQLTFIINSPSPTTPLTHNNNNPSNTLSTSPLTHPPGLPVNMLLTALAPPQVDKGYSQVVRAGMHYEAITRWHSDLFAPGRSRIYVKEDMDDARESFGIYFVDSLLKYLGKKIL